MGGQHSATALLANNVHRFCVLVGEDRWVRVECRVAHGHATSANILQSGGKRILTQRVRVGT